MGGYIQVYLEFAPHLLVSNFSYTFDYSEKNKKSFEENYNLKFDKKEKEKYESFFVFSPIEIHETINHWINFKFKFRDFCDYYKITCDKYYELVENHKNKYPFPLKGSLTIDDGNEKIDCNFGSEILNGDMIFLSFQINDKYFLKQIDQFHCEFKLIKELTPSEKKKYEEELALRKRGLRYDMFNYIL